MMAVESRPLQAAMVLDLGTVEAMYQRFAGTPVGDAAGAWLGTYRAALALGSGEVVARQQAAVAWDACADSVGAPDPLDGYVVGEPVPARPDAPLTQHLFRAPQESAYSRDRGRGISPAGRAWLAAYRVARSLGFAECVAQRQAFAAADREREGWPC